VLHRGKKHNPIPRETITSNPHGQADAQNGRPAASAGEEASTGKRKRPETAESGQESEDPLAGDDNSDHDDSPSSKRRQTSRGRGGRGSRDSRGSRGGRGSRGSR
jgi:hypothetical protein